MSERSREAIGRIAFVVALIAVAFAAGHFHGYSERPLLGYDEPENASVTCYTWVENDTSEHVCYQTAGVNLTMMDCEDYEVRIDESKPCEHRVKSGQMELGSLPTNTSAE